MVRAIKVFREYFDGKIASKPELRNRLISEGFVLTLDEIDECIEELRALIWSVS